MCYSCRAQLPSLILDDENVLYINLVYSINYRETNALLMGDFEMLSNPRRYTIMTNGPRITRACCYESIFCNRWFLKISHITVSDEWTTYE